MSIKDRIRELENKVDRIEALTERLISHDAAREIGDKIYEKVIYGDPIEIKCPRFEVNINSDPEIIGNVMRWRGEDYLRLDFIPEPEASKAARKAGYVVKYGDVWIPFSEVNITDELACMRRKEQPIWVVVTTGGLSEHLQKLIAVRTSCLVDFPFLTDSLKDKSTGHDAWTSCRLANIDDLKEAGIR